MTTGLMEPTPEQRVVCDAMRDLGLSLNEGMVERDLAGVFDRQRWVRCAQAGVLGLPIPAAYGGKGCNLTTVLRAMIALGKACKDGGLVFSMNAHMWAFELPVLHFGTEEQKRRYLPPACCGELIGAHAITEPEFGSDVMSMTARAVREGDHYVLNGVKTLITNAPVADAFLFFATVNPQMRAAGVTAFLVERGTSGMEVAGPFAKMGMRTAAMGSVTLRNCRIPLTNRLGGEGAGSMVFNSAMEWERTCIFAMHLGAMERLLETTIAYAKKRHQFGAPISRLAPIADKIVDMKVSIEAGRLLLLQAAAAKDTKGSAILEAALAKLFVSEAHVKHSLACLQIHGGYGYLTDQEIEREVRDAIPGTLYSGTSEMQRKIIARMLGL